MIPIYEEKSVHNIIYGQYAAVVYTYSSDYHVLPPWETNMKKWKKETCTGNEYGVICF
jgi:hypothetical protein